MDKKTTKNKVRISNSSINCYGSRVLTEGVDFSQFQRNPILLWMHRRGDVGNVVGTVQNIRVDGDDITGELVFDLVGETSKMVAEKWEKGTLKMVSANFDVIELSDAPEHVVPGQTAFTVTRSKLVEVSVVDIGGNDDAIVMLRRDGKDITLGNEEKGQKLPLLGKHSITDKKNNMNEIQSIALKLGLPDTATVQEILDAISVILGYKTDNETMKTELETIRLANITTLVDGAVAARKIGADKKEHFIELGKKVGCDTLKLTFDSMSVQIRPIDITGSAGLQLAKSEWKKLSDVPADKIADLRDNDKQTYMRLYKEEYGIECEL